MRNRKITIYFAFATLLLLMTELSSYALIYVSRPFFSEPIRRTAEIYRDQSNRIRTWLQTEGRARDVVDPELGWRYRAGFDGSTDQLNSMGLRGAREYSITPSDGILRVAAFGDSFVYGSEVRPEDSWASLTGELTPGVEVLNYGVGGYGLDQALLRYRKEGTALSPHIVLIGFILDDIRRVVNIYLRFAELQSGIYAKPRFLFNERKELELLPAPIKTLDDWRHYLEQPDAIIEWGQHDQWYEPLIYEFPLYDLSATVRLMSSVWIRLHNRYLDPDRLFIGDELNQSSEAFQLQMAIFEALDEEIRANNARAVVLILPSRGELARALENRDAVYAPILERLESMNIQYLDATEAFPLFDTSVDINAWFSPGGHYSPIGNRLVAEWLGPRLLEASSVAGE